MPWCANERLQVSAGTIANEIGHDMAECGVLKVAQITCEAKWYMSSK